MTEQPPTQLLFQQMAEVQYRSSSGKGRASDLVAVLVWGAQHGQGLGHGGERGDTAGQGGARVLAGVILGGFGGLVAVLVWGALDGVAGRFRFRGQPVIINFWASWCAPCRQEMPALEATWQLFRERDLVIVGINLPKSDPEESARAFLDEFGISYPNVFDTRGFTAIDYGVSGIPVTFFVDREGVVTRRFVGTLTDGSLMVWTEELVGGGEPSSP